MKHVRHENQKAFKITVKKPTVVAKPVEEPVREIDTEKAVAFGMSIVLQMKAQQKEADQARAAESTIVPADHDERYSAAELKGFEKNLLADRSRLVTDAKTLRDSIAFDEHDDVEPDGGDGTNQTMRFNAFNQMEKLNRSINEIDEALHRVKDGTYGVCASCGRLIARERLLKAPFVKTCTACQQILERSR